jgi:hypothetical protein
VSDVRRSSLIRNGHKLIRGSLAVSTTVQTIQLAVVKIAQSKNPIVVSLKRPSKQHQSLRVVRFWYWVLLWKVSPSKGESSTVADITYLSGTTPCDTASGCCATCPAYVIRRFSGMAIDSCGSLVAPTVVQTIRVAVVRTA